MFMQDQSDFIEDTKAILSSLIRAKPALKLCDGVLAGTLVETQSGWAKVESLKSGDLVQTYDGGLREIKRVEHNFFDLKNSHEGPDFLVSVPGGTLNACSGTFLLPEQRVLLEMDDQGSTPAALIRAADLCGISGITLVRPTGMLQAVRPILKDEEVLWANTGLMCHFGAISSVGKPQQSEFFQELDRKDARLAAFGLGCSDTQILQRLVA